MSFTFFYLFENRFFASDLLVKTSLRPDHLQCVGGSHPSSRLHSATQKPLLWDLPRTPGTFGSLNWSRSLTLGFESWALVSEPEILDPVA